MNVYKIQAQDSITCGYKLKSVVMFAISIENLKKLKYRLLKKHYVFVLLTVTVFMNMKKIFKEEELIKILKIRGLINNIKEHNRIYNDV